MKYTYSPQNRSLPQPTSPLKTRSKEAVDYYPFGLTHQQPLPTNLPSRYLFNGKEITTDFGLGMYDYINRNYDPATGRFWQVDPLADQMSRFSPYSYAFDNPIRFIDPDGMMPTPCPECPGSEAEQLANVMAATVSDGLTGLYNLTVGRFNGTVADNSADGVKIQINQRQDPTTVTEAVSGPVVDALNASSLTGGGGSATGNLLVKTGASIKNTAADLVEAAEAALEGVKQRMRGETGTHGNSLDSQKETYLYELQTNQGEKLKTGITSEVTPENRYTRQFMEDKQMIILDRGARRDMATKERRIVETDPGPLNKEPWAGRRRDNQ